MLRQNLNKRGTAIIEYVILLAFVAVVGSTFTNDGMSGSITNIIHNVEHLLGVATDGDEDYSNSRAHACGHMTDFQKPLSKVVDGVYDMFNKNGETLKRILIDQDGNVLYGTVYKNTGGTRDLEVEEISGLNVSNLLAGTGYTFGSGEGTIHGNTQVNSFISFKQDGTVEGAHNSLKVDGKQYNNQWSKLFLKDSNGKITEIGYNTDSKQFQGVDESKKCSLYHED